MHYEIERKFLVRGEFKHLAYESTRIAQGYIASGNGRTVRVRIRGDKGYLTIKGPSLLGGLTRYEWEQEIPLQDARDMMRICEPGIIDKTRYLIQGPDGRHTWEVDEFYGDNEGLVLAEVELESENAPYEKPDFIGREVTGDRRFYNSHMRKYPFRLWKDDIAKEP
ncbi:MAG: CYTH domain-containing protein [Bacteroidaceae bacterium]|nr:CYTH domain-containing protein [Prevotellaceae bacterium]MDY5632634.1 CYTH domain-containing protein [Bacteroidaceae bacterium]